MQIWSAEIKELDSLYTSIKGRFPQLEHELDQLIETKDANVALLYSRRCLEVIITDLCESELKRPRKTEPLKGIIDKLHREEKVPANIIASMHGLNDLSTFGAHPKEYDPEQVRPVLIHLVTIIKWYLKYKDQKHEVTLREKESEPVCQKPGGASETISVVKSKSKGIIIVSVILLIALIVVFALDIFNLFHKDKFGDLKDTDGRISIAVMPFHNMTGDSIYINWQDSFQNLLISNLSNVNELSVRQYETMIDIIGSTGHLNYASITPSAAREIALKLESNTLINGSFAKAGENIRISIQLVETKTSEIYKSFTVECKKEDEFFNMTDSLSNLLKDFLRIEVIKKEFSNHLKSAEISSFFSTTSPEALNNFVEAYKMALSLDWNSCVELLLKAVEIDPDYIYGYLWLSLVYHNMGNREKAIDANLIANKNRDKISYKDQLLLDYIKYGCLDKNPQKGVQYLYNRFEMDPQNRFTLNLIGDLNRLMHNYDREIEAYEEFIGLDAKWGVIRKWIWPYLELGDVYHIKGNHKREEELYNKALEIIPDHPNVIYRQARCALSLGNTTKANEFITKYVSIRKNQYGYTEAQVKNVLGDIYSDANILDDAEQYYRQSLDLEPHSAFILNDLARFLIKNDINIEEGLDLANQALDLRPDNYEYQYTKAFGLYKQGKNEDALELLNKSWDLRIEYDHEHFLLKKEVEQAVANQNK